MPQDIPEGLGDTLLAYIADKLAVISIFPDHYHGGFNVTMATDEAQAHGHGRTLREAVETTFVGMSVYPCARCQWRWACPDEIQEECHA